MKVHHGAGQPSFTCDLSQKGEAFPHFWEHTVGSCHASMALRADWQKQIIRCHRDLGFQHVRFHGLLSDDMSTLVREEGKLIYNFFNADQIVDFLLSVDMKPFLELSFMPTALSSGRKTVFHYKGNVTPPKDYQAWATLIENLVRHWVDRYGVKEVRKWFFEVWNEPNLKAFWTGGQASYFKLYEHSVKAIKGVDPHLQVGGPATAKNAWVPQMVKFCEQKRLPLDFVSTHHYPTDAFGKPDDDTVTQLAASHRSVLRDEAARVAKQAKGRPVYYTEWASSSNPFDELHDQPYAAAYAMKTVMEARGLVKGYSYWTFSDIFEENYFSGQPFHGGFGLMNIYGVPKPAYRAFEMLHSLGNEILEVDGHHSTVDVWATRTGDRGAEIVMTNSNPPRHPIKTQTVKLEIKNAKKLSRLSLEQIDEDHANAFKVWEDWGRPPSLSSKMVAELEKCSRLTKRNLKVNRLGRTHEVEVTLSPQATAKITLEAL